MTKDKNLSKIKKVVGNILPDSRIILFGSRNRDDFDIESDYDVLVIVKKNLTIREKRYYASLIQKKLADIPLDVIVKTEMDIPRHLNRIESVVKEAIETGIDV